MDIFNSALGFLTEPWVLLSLAAALGYAMVGFIDEWFLEIHSSKASADGDDDDDDDLVGKLVIISGIFGLVISLVFGVLALVRGDVNVLIGNVAMTQAMASGALEIIWLIPYFHAIKRSGAIDATPLFQSVPVFAFIFGLTFFSEIPTLIHIAGSLVIVGGAFLLNTNFKNMKLDMTTVLLMFLASAIISLEYFLFKDATEEGSFIASAFWSGLGMSIVGGAIWLGWKPYRNQFVSFLRSADKRAIALQFGNEGLNAVSMLASQMAITIGPSVMLVSAFNAFHPVFTLLIGTGLAAFGSSTHKAALDGGKFLQKSVAIGLIAAGTVIVALP